MVVEAEGLLSTYMSALKKIVIFSWLIIGIIVVSATSFMLLPKLQEYKELQLRQAALEADIRKEEEITHRLRADRKRFPGDKLFVERMAHDMGLARTNEVIVTFIGNEDEFGAPHP